MVLVKLGTVLTHRVLGNAATVTYLRAFCELSLHNLLSQGNSTISCAVVAAIMSLLSKVSVYFLISPKHIAVRLALVNGRHKVIARRVSLTGLSLIWYVGLLFRNLIEKLFIWKRLVDEILISCGHQLVCEGLLLSVAFVQFDIHTLMGKFTPSVRLSSEVGTLMNYWRVCFSLNDVLSFRVTQLWALCELKSILNLFLNVLA